MAERRRKQARQAQYESAAYVAILRRLAENVRALRAERELTQEDAAWQCDLPVRQFQSIEGASANVTVTTLARLCTGFELDVAALLAPTSARAARRRKPRATAAIQARRTRR